MTACARCKSRYISESQEGRTKVISCLICGLVRLERCSPCPGCGSTSRTRHSRAVALDRCVDCAMQFTPDGDALPPRERRATFGAPLVFALENARRT